jgi:hypothetical protein
MWYFENSRTSVMSSINREKQSGDIGEKSIGQQAEKFNMSPNIKMAVNLEFSLKFYSHSKVYLLISSFRIVFYAFEFVKTRKT